MAKSGPPAQGATTARHRAHGRHKPLMALTAHRALARMPDATRALAGVARAVGGVNSAPRANATGARAMDNSAPPADVASDARAATAGMRVAASGPGAKQAAARRAMPIAALDVAMTGGAIEAARTAADAASHVAAARTALPRSTPCTAICPPTARLSKLDRLAIHNGGVRSARAPSPMTLATVLQSRVKMRTATALPQQDQTQTATHSRHHRLFQTTSAIGSPQGRGPRTRARTRAETVSDFARLHLVFKN